MIDVQASAPANFVDTIPVGDGPAEAANGERDGRRRRRRRGGGGRRDEAAGFDGGNATGGESVDLAVPAIGDEPTVAPTAESERAAPRRAERAPPMPSVAEERAAVEVVHSDEAAAGNAASAVPAPARAAVAAPPVPRFELPLSDLQQLAVGAGLSWVNSDADKVSAVQQAIAAEPKPAHVPRERKVAALPDDGPLVLVETRKDLSQIALPFERQSPPRE